MQHQKRPRATWLVLALAGWLGWVTGARAHTLPISYLILVPDGDYLHLELMLNPFELNFFAEIDRNHNHRLDPAELEASGTLVARKLVECLHLRVGDHAVPPEVFGLIADFDTHHIRLRAHYRVDARTRALTVESTLATLTSGSHVTEVTFRRPGGTQSARLDMQSPRVTFAPPGGDLRTPPVPSAVVPVAHGLPAVWPLVGLGGLGLAGGLIWQWRSRVRSPARPAS